MVTAESLAERTLELVRIPSPIGGEGALADFVEKWALSRFPREHVYRRSHSLVVGNLDDPRPAVALVGHLDTVPPAAAPNPPRREGDRLYGLGSSDMKGGLAVMMALAESLDFSALPLNVVFVLYEREEGPFLESGLGPLLEDKPQLARARFGIAMEPTDNVVQVGCVGSIHALVRFAGRSAHSARPWQGENAVHKAGPFLAELLSRTRREVSFNGFTFYEVMNVTTAKGGRARNVIPESFEVNVNYRFVPGKSLEQAQQDVREVVAGRGEIQFTDLAPSGRVCSDNRLFQQLLSLTGLPAESKQAWTDVARLSEAGIDAVNFGPGETAMAHQANESCSVAALEVAYARLKDFIQKARP